MKYHYSITFSFVLMALSLTGQTYFEDFISQEEFGISGPCDSLPETCESFAIPDSVGWSIQGDASGLTANTDWFKVVNDQLSARDTDGRLCWQSSIVFLDPTSYYRFSSVVVEVGDLEETDYVDIYVNLDSSVQLISAWIGEDLTHTLVGDYPDDDDWGRTVVLADSLSGDSISITICVKNDAGTEYFRIDSLLIEDITQCALHDFELQQEICNAAVDEYGVEITYSGIDTLAFVVNLTSNGEVVTGDPIGLSGAPILVTGIPIDSSWRIEILSPTCADTLEGSPPDCANYPEIFISELDCDQQGVDSLEFIEIGGPPGTLLDSVVLTCYNGNNGSSYQSWSLSGLILNELGLVTICFGMNNQDYCDTVLLGNLQNGPDGVGLYYGMAEPMSNGSPVIAVDLLDGLRYGTGDAPAISLVLLDTDEDCDSSGCHVDEDMNGMAETESIQRGSWFVASPTPGQPNTNPLPVTIERFFIEEGQGSLWVVWTTRTEHHNAFFKLEASYEAEQFEQFARVDGAHSSRGLREYRVKFVPDTPGRYYIRLSTVAENGGIEMHGVRSIDVEGRMQSVSSVVRNGVVVVRWRSGASLTCKVMTSLGAQIAEYENLINGYAELPFHENTPGLYIVVVELAGRREVFKVIHPG